MLEYTEKLTIFLDIVQVCAYFNFGVRIVDGLGLKVSGQAAERAWRARQHAAELAKEKGVDLPDDRWDIAGQAVKAKHSYAGECLECCLRW